MNSYFAIPLTPMIPTPRNSKNPVPSETISYVDIFSISAPATPALQPRISSKSSVRFTAKPNAAFDGNVNKMLRFDLEKHAEEFMDVNEKENNGNERMHRSRSKSLEAP